MALSQKSIRFQLQVWLIVPILSLLALSVISSYYLSTLFADTAFDNGLEDQARILAGRVVVSNGKITLNTPLIDKDALEDDDFDTDYYLISGPNNEYIAGNPVLGVPATASSRTFFRDMVVDHHPIRVVATHMPFHAPGQSGSITVQMAETFQSHDTLKNKILTSTLLHQLLLILLAIGCVRIAITRGLMPLDKIREAILHRSPDDLNPIEEKTIPDEIIPLIDAINALMERLGSYILMQRRFLTDAAHQLKTPLAGLQTQVELLSREDLPAAIQPTVRQIDRGIEHASRLVQQLLALVRNESDRLEPGSFKEVNLVSLAEQVTEAFVPSALSRKIDLGVDAPDTSVLISGLEKSLYEMLSNMVDNALTYTQPGGTVTVRVLPEQKSVTLCVEDNGPGIPLAEREKVFQRFYRLHDNQTPGTGLGLSIVSEIARLHHAEVRISSGPGNKGTSVQVIFHA